MSSGMEGFSSRLSSNSNMSGAAAMRLAFAFASTSASTDATGCPHRSTTRDSFCGSIRHIPDFTLLLAIPLLSRRGSLLLLLSLFSWMRGHLSRLLRFFSGVIWGTAGECVPRGFFSFFSVMWANSILLLPIQHGRLAGFVETAGCAENISEWHD